MNKQRAAGPRDLGQEEPRYSCGPVSALLSEYSLHTRLSSSYNSSNQTNEFLLLTKYIASLTRLPPLT